MIAERPAAISSATTVPTKPKAGGSFLIAASAPSDVYTPEDFTPEMREIFGAVDEFVKNRVLPNADTLEEHDNALLKKLLHECGEQGFFLLEVPEQYGGLDLSKTLATYVGEALSYGGGFAVSFGAHASIGMLPLVYFGSDAAKDKYLEQMGAGQLIGAYCLSEPGSGSDAQAAKTKAVLSEDGTYYTMTGTKMWIRTAASLISTPSSRKSPRVRATSSALSSSSAASRASAQARKSTKWAFACPAPRN